MKLFFIIGSLNCFPEKGVFFDVEGFINLFWVCIGSNTCFDICFFVSVYVNATGSYGMSLQLFDDSFPTILDIFFFKK